MENLSELENQKQQYQTGQQAMQSPAMMPKPSFTDEEKETLFWIIDNGDYNTYYESLERLHQTAKKLIEYHKTRTP